MGDNQLKLVIVGDGACGKTCALMVFAKNQFPTKYIPTVFETYSCDLTNGWSLMLFDTAGQDDYDRLRPLSYPHSNVIMVLYDVSNPVSLENAKNKWLPEVRHYCPNVPIIFCANKVDLRNDPRTLGQLQKRGGMKPVSAEEGLKMAKELDCNSYKEFSAMQNNGIREAFNEAGRLGMLHKQRKPFPSLAGDKSKAKSSKKGCTLL